MDFKIPNLPFNLSADTIIIGLDLAFHNTGICIYTKNQLTTYTYKINKKEKLNIQNLNAIESYINTFINDLLTNLNPYLLSYTHFVFICEFTPFAAIRGSMGLNYYVYALILALKQKLTTLKLNFDLIIQNAIHWPKVIKDYLCKQNIIKVLDIPKKLNHKDLINFYLSKLSFIVPIIHHINQDETDALGLIVSYFIQENIVG